MDDKDHNGARAILRVPEVLMAIGRERGGRGFSELRDELDFPKSSLHRILRTLEHGGYIARRAGLYVLDYQSARLAQMLEWSNANLEFPASARPVMEWLASLTQESVILSGLSPSMKETIYLSVIASEAPLRYTPPPGNQPPLYSVAAGKAMLAFLPRAYREQYLADTQFLAITPFTSGREVMPAILAEVAQTGSVFDRDGSVMGASAVASPIFDRWGKISCAISVAGPTSRTEIALPSLRDSVRRAAEQISQILGFSGVYPPAPPP